MNIREAILAAADHIERNPGEFDFHSLETPAGLSCGTPGCAIGWISFFMGKRREMGHVESWRAPLVAMGVGAYGDDVFYRRMDAVLHSRWHDNAADCAAALRLYAYKYHPAPSIDSDATPNAVAEWATCPWRPERERAQLSKAPEGPEAVRNG